MEQSKNFGSWGAVIGAILGALLPALLAYVVADADPYATDVWKMVPYFLAPSALIGYVVLGVGGMLIDMIWRLTHCKPDSPEDEPPISSP